MLQAQVKQRLRDFLVRLPFVAFLLCAGCSSVGLKMALNEDEPTHDTLSQLQALLQQLLADRGPSAAAESWWIVEQASRVEYDETKRILSWEYGLSGDYDLNGEVNISDVAPLAQLIGMQPTAAGQYTREGWVDGDQNGEINSSDLVPLAGMFGESLSGYRVLCARQVDVADANQGFEALVEFPLDPHTGEWPPRYEFSIPEGYRFVQLEPLNAPGERILRQTLDVENPGGSTGNFRDFTDPRTGETYRIVDGEAFVGFKLPLDTPQVLAFIEEQQLEILSAYTEICGILAKLPEGTSVEYAVGEWPGLYPDLIEVVDPNGAGVTPHAIW